MIAADADAGWRITLRVPADRVAACEAVLAEHASAVSTFEETDGLWRVDAWTDDAPDAAALAPRLEAAAGGAAAHLEIEAEAVRDWVAENVRAFPPVDVGPFRIFGSHDAPDATPGRIGIRMDAGAAFGSGRHASTAGCLLALAALSRRRVMRPLDLGCGSGILAIAAARLWHARVLAADVDARAVAVTRANAAVNGVGPLVRAVRADGFHMPRAATAGPFDLITANILARPLKKLAGAVAAHLTADGCVVLSGFLAGDARGVAHAYAAFGLRCRRRIDIDGWHTLVLCRREGLPSR